MIDQQKLAMIMSLIAGEKDPKREENDRLVQELMQKRWAEENPGEQPMEVMPPSPPINNGIIPNPNDPGFNNEIPLDASQLEIAPPSKGNFVDEKGNPIDPNSPLYKLIMSLVAGNA